MQNARREGLKPGIENFAFFLGRMRFQKDINFCIDCFTSQINDYPIFRFPDFAYSQSQMGQGHQIRHIGWILAGRRQLTDEMSHEFDSLFCTVIRMDEAIHEDGLATVGEGSHGEGHAEVRPGCWIERTGQKQVHGRKCGQEKKGDKGNGAGPGKGQKTGAALLIQVLLVVLESLPQ